MRPTPTMNSRKEDNCQFIGNYSWKKGLTLKKPVQAVTGPKAGIGVDGHSLVKSIIFTGNQISNEEVTLA